ncbi:MAG: outer membrane protein assembly factor BamE domain-containing protein [Methylobacter sp.]
MRKMLSLFITSILITSSLTACSTHSGNIRATDQSIIEKIKIGKTTQDEVKTLLGDTQNTMSQGGKDTWTYSYHQTNIGAKAFIPFANLVGESSIGVKISNVTIEFNQNGIVENITKNTSGNK